MATTDPKEYTLIAYAGSTYDILFEFDDSGGSAIDLDADYNDITLRIFQQGNKANPEQSLSVSGGELSIVNTNQLSGSLTKSETESLNDLVLFYELEFELSNGNPEVFIFGRFLCKDADSFDQNQANGGAFTINQNTLEVTLADSIDAAAAAAASQAAAESAANDAANFTALEQVNDLGTISGSTQIDLSNGTVVQATLSGSVTLSFTGLPDSGTEVSFTLAFSGAETITWPSGTEFAGGSAPSIIGPDYELPCSIDSAGNLTVYGVIDEIA